MIFFNRIIVSVNNFNSIWKDYTEMGIVLPNRTPNSVEILVLKRLGREGLS